MQVFNEINCRKIKGDEYNVFANFFNNPMFLIILAVTLGVQIIFVFLGGEAVHCVKPTLIQMGISVGIGLASIIFGLLMKLIVPVSLFSCLKGGSKEMSDHSKTKSFHTMIRRNTTRSKKNLKESTTKKTS
jgi:hypothetical protein